MSVSRVYTCDFCGDAYDEERCHQMIVGLDQEPSADENESQGFSLVTYKRVFCFDGAHRHLCVGCCHAIGALYGRIGDELKAEAKRQRPKTGRRLP